jgi:RHH-type proline utilization regulon transcriptional repressor/proline dehydrogenase/delta 1-pyrroline-5-carboxylate dehydrogenase
MDMNADSLLRRISACAYASETECVAAMLPFAEPFERKADEIAAAAKEAAAYVRDGGSGAGIEAFLHEYRLSDKEGVAVMGLAEALLRVPDKETADRLIASAFGESVWEGRDSESFYVHAASRGLSLVARTLRFGRGEGADPLGVLRSAVQRCGAPVIRQSLRAAMHLIAGRFVLGEDMDAALAKAKGLEKRGYLLSYDMLGEGARSAAQADAYFASYLDAIRKIAARYPRGGSLRTRPSVSVKLTALHPRYERTKRERVLAELLPKVKTLMREATEAEIAVSIDAEEASRLDLELELFRLLRLDPDFAGYDGIGFVLQAYGKRAWPVIDFLTALARESGRRIPVRLVKGAYWDTEIKAAQIQGLADYPVFTEKCRTDVSYLACARRLLDRPDCFFPQFATHNAHTVAAIREYAGGAEYEFQRLYGMGERLYDLLVRDAPCRVYAPVGEHRDLLAYLIRRLLENGANSSFVYRATDKSIPLDEAIADPIAEAKALQEGASPALRKPPALYGEERPNSRGVDFGSLAETEALADALSPFREKEWRAGEGLSGRTRQVMNPARFDEGVGAVTEASAEDVERAAYRAGRAFLGWESRPVQERAAVLRRAGDLLEERRAEFIALCVREAGKTVKDAVAEVREAVDFCRYYANEACRLMGEPVALPGPTGESNVLTLHPRGVFACISPWNFPLAIFIGQVSAALAAGNCVLAKPAEQTPLVAALAVRLLHEAGVPEDALHLLPGSGETVGEALVRHPLVAGVCFTGSLASAKRIQRRLAGRDGPILPFVAETGGINCLIADGSALPEQLCDDAISSAFGSAGQRCSALRLLFLPEAAIEGMLSVLLGALRELEAGDPWRLSTDVGPVIDGEAQTRLESHVAALEEGGASLLGSLPLGEGTEGGHFVAPQIWELKSASQLTEESFGPILHVVRYRPEDRDSVLDEINRTGYGLTFGLHSRVMADHAGLARRVKAGNIYVNRGMTGAVVGTQPFGGEGLSGTGFKAGGPHYLLRFVTERVVTVNTAAIGGDVKLLGRGDN